MIITRKVLVCVNWFLLRADIHHSTRATVNTFHSYIFVSLPSTWNINMAEISDYKLKLELPFYHPFGGRIVRSYKKNYLTMRCYLQQISKKSWKVRQSFETKITNRFKREMLFCILCFEPCKLFCQNIWY